jgi:hypothetical protein
MALSEEHSFSIDSYKHLSVDWSLSPNGRTYSNKAPGPTLYAFPVYWTVDKCLSIGLFSRSARDVERMLYKNQILKILSVLLQAFPMAILTLVVIKWLERRHVSWWGLQITALALLFGNTAAIMMNTFFGHALTAVFIVAMTYALVTDRPLLFGFCAGSALLCDYTASFLVLIGVIVYIWNNKPRVSRAWRVLLGASGPLILWVWYHTAAFGSPFTTSYAYLNPLLTNLDDRSTLFGFVVWPDHRAIVELVAGFTRGLLWTQPWVLAIFILGLSAFVKKDSYVRTSYVRSLLAFLLPALIVLILINASINPWHAGSAPGPRYLSILLPAYALLLGVLYDTCAPSVRRLLWGFVIAAVFFYFVAFNVSILPNPGRTLAGFYLKRFREGLGTAEVYNLCVSGVFFAVAFVMMFFQRPKSPAHSS